MNHPNNSNLFLYCSNNPINISDPEGKLGEWILGLLNPAVALAVVVVAATVIIAIAIKNKYDPDPYARPGQKNSIEKTKTKIEKRKILNQETIEGITCLGPLNIIHLDVIIGSFRKLCEEKMNPVFCDNWKGLYPQSIKNGISLHFSNVHPYVRSWVIIYTKWLRKILCFPVHVNVYCVFGHKIRCCDHSLAYGRIIEPINRVKHPIIYLACGSFLQNDEIDEFMRDETELILYTFSHEIIHYFQYINGYDMTTKGIEWQATYYGKRLLKTFDSLYDGYDDE